MLRPAPQQHRNTTRIDGNRNPNHRILREVHLIAFKEIERLNPRIAELESRDRQPQIEKPSGKPQAAERPADTPPPAANPPVIEIMNEKQLAAYLNISVGSVRRWRLFRQGPKFMKIGASVRYRREDVSSWLESCPGMR